MRKLLSILIVVIFLFSVAGCGSKDKDDKERTVKVFVAVGNFQVEQGSLNGIQLALDEVNSQVGKTHVEIVYVNTSAPEDDYSADKEVEAANQAASDKSVIAYIGMVSSGQAKQAIPILNKAGIAGISFSATWPGLTKTGFGAGEPGIYYPAGTRTFFRIVTSDEVQGAAGAYWANEQGYKKICLIDDGQTYGAGVAGIFNITANDLGLEVVCHEQFDPTVKSIEGYTDLASSVIATNPDAVYIGGMAAEGVAEVIAALRQQKPGIPIIGADGIVLHDDLVTNFGAETVEGVSATDVIVPTDQLGTDIATQFAATYQAKYNTAPSAIAVGSYESMRVILHAIEKSKSPTRANILNALHNLGDYVGAFGTWTFDANGDTTLPTICIWQIQDGVWKYVERPSMKM